MNKRQKKTLAQLFQNPVKLNISWRQVESLFRALGAKKIEGDGSRVRFELHGVVATFHRPHPCKEAKPYQVRDTREFLEKTGVVK